MFGDEEKLKLLLRFRFTVSTERIHEMFSFNFDAKTNVQLKMNFTEFLGDSSAFPRKRGKASYAQFSLKLRFFSST